MLITYRIDISEIELENLHNIIEYAREYADIHLKNEEEELYFSKNLLEKINNPKKIRYSAKKANSTEIATKKRSENAKKKVQNAIELLTLQGMKTSEITPFRVSKISGVSFKTAQKYLE